MPRPENIRRVHPCSAAAHTFKPAGVPLRELSRIVLTADQAEAVRLADLEGMYHSAAARRMGVSRQTFGRVLAGARRTIADAVLNRKALRMEGGTIAIKETDTMHTKIAVPTREGRIDEHFGHCEYFAVFETADNTITAEKTVASPDGCGCKSNIAAELAGDGVTLMIAGNMGTGAVRTLNSHGIQVLRGAAGSAREAVQAWLSGQLRDSGEVCREHEHSCAH